jgi:anthranilate phosphoribosyltransferase
MSSYLTDLAEAFRRKQDLRPSQAEEFLDAVITEQNEDLLVQMFVAWREKGIADEEIFGLARVLRERCRGISSVHETFVDIVGTGGSRSKTLNVSTAAAFVAAGTGLPVAKHGNRAATSRTGSADVLSALGVDPAADPETSERNLNELGICFMFAPNHHRLSPTLASVRRKLGFPTIFNCVGPLCNPAVAPHQLIGAWDVAIAGKMASALRELGTRRSWVVVSESGLDEIALDRATEVFEVSGEQIDRFRVAPEDLGVPRLPTDHLKCESPDESAAVIRKLVSNHGPDPAARSLVLINAAAAVHIAGGETGLAAAFERSKASIDQGRAAEKLAALSAAGSVGV